MSVAPRSTGATEPLLRMAARGMLVFAATSCLAPSLSAQTWDRPGETHGPNRQPTLKMAAADPAQGAPSDRVGAGTQPAGLPTPDAPAPNEQAPRTLASGRGQTSWDTFLYEGPGYRYAVVDEVSQGQVLQILDCGHDWCRVVFDGGREGYIIAEVLTAGDPAKAAPGFLPNPATAIIDHPQGPCLDAMQTEGNGGTMPTRYCQKASQ